MGLTIEARVNVAYNAICNIVEAGRNFDANSPNCLKDRPCAHGGIYFTDAHHELGRLTGELWHALLSPHRNPTHWILGSDSEKPVDQKSSSPFAVVIRLNVDSMRYDHDNEVPIRDDDLPFDPLAEQLSIESILRKREEDALPQGLDTVFRIYRLTEDLMYGVRRYSDNAFGHHLDWLISQIQGTCYEIFCENTQFTEAYLVHRLCHIIYGPMAMRLHYDTCDFVSRWLIDEHLHHEFTKSPRHFERIADLIALHRDLANRLDDELHKTGNDYVRAHKRIAFARLRAALRMLGERYSSSHSQRKLLQKLTDPQARNDLGDDEHEFVAYQIKNDLAAHCSPKTNRKKSPGPDFNRRIDRKESAVHGHFG